MQLNVSANDRHFSLFHSFIFASTFEELKTTHRSYILSNLIFIKSLYLFSYNRNH